MALIKCPDCGKEYSSRATVCPNCGCPNDYKAEKEEKELQADVNLAVKVDVKKEIILRVVVIIISVIAYSPVHEFLTPGSLDVNNNLFILCATICLITSIFEGFRNRGVAEAIISPIRLIFIFLIIMMICLFVSKDFYDNYGYVLGYGLCAIYSVPYFLRPLRLFIKYNVLKQDVDLKSLTENIE